MSDAPQVSEGTTTVNAATRTRHPLLWFMVLALATIVVGGGLWLRDNVAQVESKIAQLYVTVHTLENEQAQRAAEAAQLQTDNAALQQDVQMLSHTQATLRAQLPEHWPLYKAYHTVELLNQRLWLVGDTQTAIETLAALDASLQGSLPYRQAREAIYDDLAALKAYQKVDKEMLWLQLDKLETLVSTLPFRFEATTPAAPEAVAPADTGWREKLSGTLKHLQGLVSIKKRDADAPQLAHLTKTEWLRLTQLQIESAKWALLHEKPTLYTDSLTALAETFQAAAPTTGDWQEAFDALSALQAVGLEATVPTLNASQKALAQALEVSQRSGE